MSIYQGFPKIEMNLKRFLQPILKTKINRFYICFYKSDCNVILFSTPEDGTE